MSTLQTYVDRVISLISDKGKQLEEGANIERAVQDAVVVFSQSHPIEAIEDVVGDGSTYIFSLPSGYSVGDGISRIISLTVIDSADYPNGSRSDSVVDDLDWEIRQIATSTWKLVLLEDTPGTGDYLRIKYAKAHTVSTSSSTIQTNLEPALTYKAAEMACLMMAASYGHTTSPTVSADSVSYGTKSAEWTALAGEFQKMFMQAIGVRSDEQIEAGFAVAERDWRLPWGEDLLTHPKRWF